MPYTAAENDWLSGRMQLHRTDDRCRAGIEAQCPREDDLSRVYRYDMETTVIKRVKKDGVC